VDALARSAKREGGRGWLEVDLGQIQPSRDNPRREFDPEKLQQLADSLRQHGMLEPLVVIRRDAGFEIVAGERRYRAARLAGWTKVPVVILDEQDPRHLAELRLIENLQREDLNAVEIARAYHALAQDHGLTHEQIGQRVGQDRATVSNLIRILALPTPILDQVGAGKLSLGHAKALLAVADPARQQALAEQAATFAWSVRELERRAAEGKAPAVRKGGATGKSAAVREQEQNLQLLFNARVSIRERGPDRGELTVHFDSKDQYHRIVTILGQIMKRVPGGG
jgi:ParB family chromosome partitioning protein